MLVLNLALALIWMALQRSFSLVDLAVGFGFGFLIVSLAEPLLRDQVLDTAQWRAQRAPGSYPRRVIKLFGLIGFTLWSIIKANIDMARIVLRPKLKINPGIIAIPLDVRSEIGITLLANLITLTPGTVSLDVSQDRRTIYVHSIDIKDAEAIRKEIKESFEQRVMELFP